MLGSQGQMKQMVRFFLEVAAYASMATWGWQMTESGLRFIIGPGIAVFAAVLWGTFGVSGDPTRNRKPPVEVPGSVRLALEALFFLFAAWALIVTDRTTFAVILVVVAIGHYAASYDRVRWMLGRKGDRDGQTPE